jgi:putative endonuclease
VKGYSIRERNFRVRAGELDLVAESQGIVVFVEVKCRKSDVFSSPGEAVTLQKQRKLRTAASLWLARHGGDQKPARFDVVEVIFGLSDKAPRIHHIVNAF